MRKEQKTVQKSGISYCFLSRGQKEYDVQDVYAPNY